jgi:alkylhydroperoxidase family enzyme
MDVLTAWMCIRRTCGKWGNLKRINLIMVWHEVPFFTAKEKAVLELTEAVTHISAAGVPLNVYEKVLEHFSEKEYLTLIMAINTINCWNRIAISAGMFPGCL